MIIENGTAAPTMACVDGIPYSSSHFVSRRITGGESGRGHRMMSLRP